MLRIAIIGCGAEKLPHPAPARALYTGCLFRDALGHAEAQGFDLLLIMSACYGLLDLEREVAPYDLAMEDLGPARREVVGAHVRRVLRFRAGGAAELTIFAARPYAELLRPLAAEGWALHEPLAGLTQGARRRWFAERRKGAARAA